MKLSTKIKLALRSLVLNAGSLETDKAVLQYEGDELEVGKEVFIEVEGEIVPAEDGEYVAGEKTYVVADGKVTEIKEEEKETIEETVEVTASKQKFNAIKAVYEDSYEDKERKIIEAIRGLGFNDSWLVEAGDDFAVVEIWNDEAGDYKHTRFEISWNEDGEAIASNPVEVKSEFVPVEETPAETPVEPQEFEETPEPADEPETVTEEPKTTEQKVDELAEAVGDIREGIEQLTNAIAKVAQRLEEVEKKLSGLEEPAAEPAEEGEETEVKASRLSYLKR